MTSEQAYRDCEIINNLNLKESFWSCSQNQINGFDRNERLLVVNGLPFSGRGAPYDNEFKCLIHDFVFHYNFLTVTTDQLLLQID